MEQRVDEPARQGHDPVHAGVAAFGAVTERGAGRTPQCVTCHPHCEPDAGNVLTERLRRATVLGAPSLIVVLPPAPSASLAARTPMIRSDAPPRAMNPAPRADSNGEDVGDLVPARRAAGRADRSRDLVGHEAGPTPLVGVSKTSCQAAVRRLTGFTQKAPGAMSRALPPASEGHDDDDHDPMRPRRFRAAAALVATAVVAGSAGAALHAATNTSSAPSAPTAVAAATTSVAEKTSSHRASRRSTRRTRNRSSRSPADDDHFAVRQLRRAAGPGHRVRLRHRGSHRHEPARDRRNEHVTVTFADGSKAKATVVGSDASTDIAILKVDVAASKLRPVSFADSGGVGVGDGVIAIGDPFGLDNTVTAGIVSAIDREIAAPDDSPIEGAIQTTPLSITATPAVLCSTCKAR